MWRKEEVDIEREGRNKCVRGTERTNLKAKLCIWNWASDCGK